MLSSALGAFFFRGVGSLAGLGACGGDGASRSSPSAPSAGACGGGRDPQREPGRGGRLRSGREKAGRGPATLRLRALGLAFGASGASSSLRSLPLSLLQQRGGRSGEG
jgi:hypothetical protein